MTVSLGSLAFPVDAKNELLVELSDIPSLKLTSGREGGNTNPGDQRQFNLTMLKSPHSGKVNERAGLKKAQRALCGPRAVVCP